LAHTEEARSAGQDMGGILNVPRTLRGRLHILACPVCSGSLEEGDDALTCITCQEHYPVRGGKIYFASPPPHKTQASDFKHRLRQLLGARYKAAVRFFGPGFPWSAKKLLLENADPTVMAVVDLGSGTERLHVDVITLDLFDYPEVDIVCDLQTLPFGVGKVDAFITTSVIEHIEDAAGLVDKLFERTRAGGIGIHSFPFLFPYHEAPGDFARFTHMGARALFKKWNVRRLFNCAGPVTLLNTSAVEFFSSLLSFGNNRVKEVIYLGFCALVFPFKYLDVLFINRPRFLSTSAVLCIVIDKPLVVPDEVVRSPQLPSK
jgi:hypothetical protein